MIRSLFDTLVKCCLFTFVYYVFPEFPNVLDYFTFVVTTSDNYNRKVDKIYSKNQDYYFPILWRFGVLNDFI